MSRVTTPMIAREMETIRAARGTVPKSMPTKGAPIGSAKVRPKRNEPDLSKTKQSQCVRCDGDRWIPAGVREPYTCQRCRSVLAGKNVADPLGSVAQRAALVKARQRLPQRRGEGPEGHNPEGGAGGTPPPVLGGRPWQQREEPEAVAPMPDMGTEGLDGQSRSAWLRSVFENSDYFQHLAEMLNSGRLFEKAWAPLLRDLRARGWISGEDLALWHSRPVVSPLRWVSRRTVPRPQRDQRSATLDQ
jgi:hypothetical protein